MHFNRFYAHRMNLFYPLIAGEREMVLRLVIVTSAGINSLYCLWVNITIKAMGMMMILNVLQNLTL